MRFHQLFIRKKLARFCITGMVIGAFQFSGICSTLEGVQPESTLDIYGGYRMDRITTCVKTEEEEETIEKDKLKAKRLSIVEIGAKGQISLCDYWFLKGWATYGWGHHGRYHEKLTSFEEPTFVSKSDASIHRSRFRDCSVGFGYLYPIGGWWGCWGMGPVVGWQYDDQVIRMHNAQTDGAPDPILDGLKYKTRWSGPWVGADALYECCGFYFRTGLEYHFITAWHASWRLDGPDIPDVAFSDKRHSNQAWGIVLYGNVDWNFFDCWHIGAGAKWQRWEAEHGRLKPSDPLTELAIPSDIKFEIDNARWYSWEATINLGYMF